MTSLLPVTSRGEPSAIFSVVQNDNSIANGHHGSHDVFDHEDGNAAILYLAQQFEGTVHFRGRQSCHHLVEKEEFRAGGESTRQFQSTPVRRRHLVRSEVRFRGETDQLQRFRGTLASIHLVQAISVHCSYQDIIRNRHAGERLHDLEGAGNPHPADDVRLLTGDGLALYRILPDVGRRIPEMTLNRVVLPEPFGPIIPRMSPWFKVRSMAWTATNSSNFLVTWSSFRISMGQSSSSRRAPSVRRAGPGPRSR